MNSYLGCKRRLASLLLTLALLALATGCWDRVEIEKRGFVIGAAVDLLDPEQSSEDAPANPLYKLTNQIVIPTMLVEGGEQGGTEGAAYLNVSATGATILGITRKMATSTSRSPFVEHLKLIIISEQVARAGLIDPVLDVYMRDHEMRRSTQILVSEGPAADILEVDAENEWLPALFIQSIAENTHKSGSLLPGVRIGEVQEHMMEGYSFVLPRIAILNGKVGLAGAAVFRSGDNRMAGWLDGDMTEGLNLIHGELVSSVVEFEWKGQMCTFEIKRVSRTMGVELNDGSRPAFTIDLVASGNVGEMHTDRVDSPEYWAEIERAVATKIESRIERLIDKLQGSYYVDAFGFGRHLQRKYYKQWEKLRHQWEGPDGAFAESTISTRVKVEVRGMGTLIRTDG